MCAMYAVDVERRVSNIYTIWVEADSYEQADRRAIECAYNGKTYVGEPHETNLTFSIMSTKKAEVS